MNLKNKLVLCLIVAGVTSVAINAMDPMWNTAMSSKSMAAPRKISAPDVPTMNTQVQAKEKQIKDLNAQIASAGTEDQRKRLTQLRDKAKKDLDALYEKMQVKK